MGLGPILGTLVSGIAGSLGGKKSESTTANVDSTTTAQQADLPPQLLDSLRVLFQGLSNSGGSQFAQASSINRLADLRDFDPDQFATDITGQAAAAAGLEQESAINDTLSRAGGGRGSSSAALIENRIRNQTAANLAGVSAGARAQGEQLKSQGVSTASQDIASQLANIIALTRGSTVSGSLREKGTQATNGSARAGGGIGGFLSGLASGASTFFGGIE